MKFHLLPKKIFRFYSADFASADSIRWRTAQAVMSVLFAFAYSHILYQPNSLSMSLKCFLYVVAFFLLLSIAEFAINLPLKPKTWNLSVVTSFVFFTIPPRVVESLLLAAIPNIETTAWLITLSSSAIFMYLLFLRYSFLRYYTGYRDGKLVAISLIPIPFFPEALSLYYRCFAS